MSGRERMGVDSSVVERLFQVLVEEVRESRPEYLRRPFTVAEIYQTLVPYRSHRDAIGVELNADYEDALLRLLAGEGEFLFLDSDPARRRLRAEVDSKNPNTGIYRDYAAVEVRLNPVFVPEAAPRAGENAPQGGVQHSLDEVGFGSPSGVEPRGEDDSGPAAPELGAQGASSPHEGPQEREDAGSGNGRGRSRAASDGTDRRPRSSESDLAGGGSENPELGASAEEAFRPEVAGEETEAPSRSRGTAPASNESRGMVSSEPRGGSSEPTAVHDVPEECPDCRGDLPFRDTLRYCPFCGTNVFVVDCGECGEELERAWRFCVACGTSVAE